MGGAGRSLRYAVDGLLGPGHGGEEGAVGGERAGDAWREAGGQGLMAPLAQPPPPSDLSQRS